MKPFSMNLSKFKKVSNDKYSTTLKDPNGHEIRVVHSALPAALRKQLEGLPTHFDEGGSADSQKPIEVNVNTTPVGNPPAVSPAAQMVNQPINAQAGPTPPNENLISSDQTLNAPAAVSLEQKAAREQQAIDQAKGIQTANIEKGYNDQRAAIAQQDQQNINAVKQHADEFSHYIAQNGVDPNHYMESRSSGQKVSNAIGLFLGGMKQGLVGGSNPALDFINSQIDRDINAQKANVENQKSIYSAYRELYGDQLAASSATKASMLDIYAHQMQQMAAQLGTPQAQANADLFAAKSAIERNDLLLNTAGRLGQLGPRVLGQAAPAAGAQTPASAQTTAQTEPQEEKRWFEKSPAEALHDAVLGSDKQTSTAAPKEMVELPTEDKILKPNAKDILDQSRYVPKFKEQAPLLQEKYAAAVNTEKALLAVNNLMPKLRKEATLSGNLAQHINPHAMAAVTGLAGGALGAAGAAGALGSNPVTAPFMGLGVPTAAGTGATAGAAVGEGAGHALQGAMGVLGGQSQIDYTSDKQELHKILLSALSKTAAGSGDINEIIDGLIPGYWDSKATYLKKMKNIKEILKQNTDTAILEDAGIAKETKR